jgi:prepilin-type N-terminal cleavage/methylation domain-containing protein
METMNELKKPGIMAKLRNRKGFSLIEMAIVLVIIGLIIAAIIKGQDLMVNAKAKQLITAANSWKSSIYGYADRNGRFPGDITNKNGVIGDVAAEQAAGASAIDEIVPTMPSAPANPVVIGGQSFWFYIGNTPATTPLGGTRNCIVICKSKACTTLLSNDDVELLKTLDTALDGSADAGVGQVRAITTLPVVGTIVTTLAAVQGRDNGVAIAPVTADTTNVGATLPWDNTQYGAIWTFDKPY